MECIDKQFPLEYVENDWGGKMRAEVFSKMERRLQLIML